MQKSTENLIKLELNRILLNDKNKLENYVGQIKALCELHPEPEILITNYNIVLEFGNNDRTVTIEIIPKRCAIRLYRAGRIVRKI